MNSSFDAIIDRRSTDSIKWNFYAEDVLPMWVADMDFLSPPVVTEVLKQRAEHGIFGYPRVEPALTAAIQAHLMRKYHWAVEADQIVYLPGVVIAFNLAVQALAQPGGNVIFNTPVYMPFLEVAKNAGLNQLSVDLIQDASGRYQMDWDKFEAAVAAGPGVFLLCNPHNPAGRVFTRAELQRMAEICLRHNVPIVSDEIHSDLTFSGHPHTPIASLSPEVAAATITLMAPSKSFNIPGLGCSFAVIPNAQMRSALNLARRGLVHGANLMGMAAARAAYEHGQEWLDSLLGYLEINRDYLVDFIHSRIPHASVSTPEGTYLAWIDLRAYNLEPSPSEYLVKNAKVGLNNGKEFGSGGDGFVRLNFGCPRSILQEGLERIEKALAAVPLRG
jgi:cystathionine beta-lyase